MNTMKYAVRVTWILLISIVVSSAFLIDDALADWAVFKGYVRDGDGNPIANHTVRIRDIQYFPIDQYPGGTYDAASATTNASGYYEISTTYDSTKAELQYWALVLPDPLTNRTYYPIIDISVSGTYQGQDSHRLNWPWFINDKNGDGDYEDNGERVQVGGSQSTSSLGWSTGNIIFNPCATWSDYTYNIDFKVNVIRLYSVSGLVKYEDGEAIGEERIFVCSATESATRANGTFSNDTVPSAASWQILVPAGYKWQEPYVFDSTNRRALTAQADYTWSPSVIFSIPGVSGNWNRLNITTTGRDLSITFTADKYKVSGVVKDGGVDGNNVSDVRVTLTKSGGGTTTDYTGREGYSFDAAKGTYTISASRAGYTFDPRAYSNVLVTRDEVFNFYTYTISGRVTDGGRGVNNVQVLIDDLTHSPENPDFVLLSGNDGYYEQRVMGGDFVILADGEDDGSVVYLTDAGSAEARVTINPQNGSATNVNFRAVRYPIPVISSNPIKLVGWADFPVHFSSSQSTGTWTECWWTTTGNLGDYRWSITGDTYNGATVRWLHPHITYYKPGTYTVTLTLKGPLTTTGSEPQASVQVQVYPKLTPVIAASSDAVDIGGTVTLDASTSTGTNIKWTQAQWQVTSQFGSWTLVETLDGGRKKVYRTPASISNQGGVWARFNLTLEDNVGTQAAAPKDIYVNRPPAISSAGAAATSVDIGNSVGLNVVASDPDSPYAALSTLTYSWSIVSGPSTVDNSNLTNRFTTSPTFTAPSTVPIGESNVVTLKVVASDGRLNAEKEFSITVNSRPRNVAITPAQGTVFEGGRPVVNEGKTVKLKASADDPEGGTIDTFEWSFGANTPQAVKDANDLSGTSTDLTFNAPEGITAVGEVVVTLKVKAKKGNLTSDEEPTVQIKINRKPNEARGGTAVDEAVELSRVTLQGVPTTDFDTADTLYYKWELVKDQAWLNDVDVPVTMSIPTEPKGTFSAPVLPDGMGSALLTFRLATLDRTAEYIAEKGVGFKVPASPDLDTHNRVQVNVVEGDFEVTAKILRSGDTQERDIDQIDIPSGSILNLTLKGGTDGISADAIEEGAAVWTIADDGGIQGLALQDTADQFVKTVTIPYDSVKDIAGKIRPKFRFTVYAWTGSTTEYGHVDKELTINRAPYFERTEETQNDVEEREPVVIELPVKDPDNDTLYYDWTIDEKPQDVQIVIEGKRVRFIAPELADGQTPRTLRFVFSVTVRDRYDTGIAGAGFEVPEVYTATITVNPSPYYIQVTPESANISGNEYTTIVLTARTNAPMDGLSFSWDYVGGSLTKDNIGLVPSPSIQDTGGERQQTAAFSASSWDIEHLTEDKAFFRFGVTAQKDEWIYKSIEHEAIVDRKPVFNKFTTSTGDNTVYEQDSIRIDAVVDDPDTEDNIYTEWIAIGDPKIEGFEVTGEGITFTAPAVAIDTNYTFRLVSIRDRETLSPGRAGFRETINRDITITVKNVTLTVEAKAKQGDVEVSTVNEGTVVTLEANVTGDDALSKEYIWEQVVGYADPSSIPQATLEFTRDLKDRKFTAPTSTYQGQVRLRFKLTVRRPGTTDDAGIYGTGTVDVIVNRTPYSAVVSADKNEATAGTVVALQATASDYDGEAPGNGLTLEWEEKNGDDWVPHGSYLTVKNISRTQAEFEAPLVLGEKEFIFRIKATDRGGLFRYSNDVRITVQPSTWVVTVVGKSGSVVNESITGAVGTRTTKVNFRGSITIPMDYPKIRFDWGNGVDSLPLITSPQGVTILNLQRAGIQDNGDDNFSEEISFDVKSSEIQGIQGPVIFKAQLKILDNLSTVWADTKEGTIRINRPPYAPTSEADKIANENKYADITATLPNPVDPDNETNMTYRWQYLPVDYDIPVVITGGGAQPQGRFFVVSSNTDVIRLSDGASVKMSEIPADVKMRFRLYAKDESGLETQSTRDLTITVNRRPKIDTYTVNPTHIAEESAGYPSIAMSAQASDTDSFDNDSPNDITYLWTVSEAQGLNIGTVTSGQISNEATYELGKNGTQQSILATQEGKLSLTVNLTVKDSNGIEVSRILETVSINRIPIAIAGARVVGAPEPRILKVVNAWPGNSIELIAEAEDKDGDLLDYNWTIIDARPASLISQISISDANTTQARFTIPPTVDQNETEVSLTIEFTATEKDTIDKLKRSDTVKVEINRNPTVEIKVKRDGQEIPEPILIHAGEAITLDGSSSHDPDGAITNYKWELVSANTSQGVSLSNLSSTGNASPVFTVPDIADNVAMPVTVQFRLTVTGNTQTTDDSTTGMTPIMEINRRPHADVRIRGEADRSITVTEGDTIVLEAGINTIDPDGDSIAGYQWVQHKANGDERDLPFATPNSQTCDIKIPYDFIPQGDDENKTIVAGLVVTDSRGLESKKEANSGVVITIMPYDVPAHIIIPDDFPTIKDALDVAVDPTTRYTIEVRGGRTYSGLLDLKGEGKDGITIISSYLQNNPGSLPDNFTNIPVISGNIRIYERAKIMGFVITGSVEITPEPKNNWLPQEDDVFIEVAYNKIKSSYAAVDTLVNTNDILPVSVHNNILISSNTGVFIGGIGIPHDQSITIENNSIDSGGGGINIACRNVNTGIYISGNIITVEDSSTCVNIRTGTQLSISDNYLYVRPGNMISFMDPTGNTHSTGVDVSSGNILKKGWIKEPLYVDMDDPHLSKEDFHLHPSSSASSAGMGAYDSTGEGGDAVAEIATDPSNANKAIIYPDPMNPVENTSFDIYAQIENISLSQAQRYTYTWEIYTEYNRFVKSVTSDGSGVIDYEGVVYAKARITGGLPMLPAPEDGGLDPKFYKVHVKVYDQNGVCISMPVKPKDFDIGVSNNYAFALLASDSITIEWDDNSTTEEYFIVDRRESGREEDPWVKIAEVTGPNWKPTIGKRSYTNKLTAIEARSTWNYRVGAYKAGVTHYPDEESSGGYTNAVLISAPDNLRAIALSREGGIMVALAWNASYTSTRVGAVLYKVYRETNRDLLANADLINLTPIAKDLTLPQHRDNDAVKGVRYYYKILAYCARFASSYSNICEVFVPEDNIPPSVRIVSPKAGDIVFGIVPIEIEAIDNEKDPVALQVRYRLGTYNEILIGAVVVDGYDGVNKASATVDWNTINTVPPGDDYSIRISTRDGAIEDIVSPIRVIYSTPPWVQINTIPATPRGTVPFTVGFEEDSNTIPLKRQWDFGDGHKLSFDDPKETGYGKNVTHTYERPGTFAVTLTVEGPTGTGTGSRNVVVLPSAPEASFTADRTEGDIPFTVKFTDTSGGFPSSWSWTFGDGGTSTTSSPSHTYNTPGIYKARLTIQNSQGTSISEPMEIRVTPYASGIEAIPAEVPAGRIVNFQALNVIGGISSYVWDFDLNESGINEQGSNLASTTHVYNTAGQYKAQLTLISSRSRFGVYRTAPITINVLDSTPPTVNITHPDNYAYMPFRIDTAQQVMTTYYYTVPIRVEGEVQDTDLYNVTVSIPSMSRFGSSFEGEATILTSGRHFVCDATITATFSDTPIRINVTAEDMIGNRTTDYVYVRTGYKNVISMPSHSYSSVYRNLSGIAVAKDMLYMKYLNYPQYGTFPTNKQIHEAGIGGNHLVDSTKAMIDNDLDPYGMKKALGYYDTYYTYKLYPFDYTQSSGDFNEFAAEIARTLTYPIKKKYAYIPNEVQVTTTNGKSWENNLEDCLQMYSQYFENPPFIPVPVVRGTSSGGFEWVIVTGCIINGSPFDGKAKPWGGEWTDEDILIRGFYVTDTHGSSNSFMSLSDFRSYMRPMPYRTDQNKYKQITFDWGDYTGMQSGYGELRRPPKEGYNYLYIFSPDSRSDVLGGENIFIYCE